MRRSLFLILLSMTSAILRADIEVNTSIEDVDHRGRFERAGSITFTINDDDFVHASPEAPIYFRITPDHDSRLAATLVDQSQPSYARIARPIFLAMTLIDPTGDATLVAAPETISIVRMVAGERAFWIRIATSSSTWIERNGETFDPNEDYKVAFTIGIDEDQTVAVMEEVDATDRNLPFNTSVLETQGDIIDASNTAICLDLTNSSLDTTGIESLLSFDSQLYDSGVAIGNGMYDGQAGQPIISTLPVTYIGRAKRRDISVTRPGEPRPVMRRTIDNGLQAISGTIPILLSEPEGNDVLETTAHPWSRLELTCEGEDYGFPADAHIDFISTSDSAPCLQQPGMSSLEDPFELNGVTLYRRVVLGWTGAQAPLDGLDWSTSVELVGLHGLTSAPLDLTIHIRPDELYSACAGETITLEEGTIDFYEQVRYIAHVTRADGGFETDLLLTNNSEVMETLTLTAFDREGMLISALVRPIDAGVTETVPVATLFDETVSHLEVRGTSAVAVAAVYRAAMAGAVPAQVWAEEETSPTWLLRLGDRALTYDGLAVVNTSATPTPVHVRFTDATGQVVAETVLTDALAGGAKGLFNLGSIAPEESTAAQITAEVPLALTALRGDYPSDYLWKNPARRIETPGVAR